jgi:hypothetical protein
MIGTMGDPMQCCRGLVVGFFILAVMLVHRDEEGEVPDWMMIR